ncbi:MAG: hypothetical protein HZB53_12545 [Chloroflexi bacterium]|nr:hypothetical protein [Chloroflexota bacterium]
MKQYQFVLAIVISSFLLLGAGLAVAQGPQPQSVPGPTGSFVSAFTIQNLGSSVASCVYQFYNASGVSVYTSAAFTVSVDGSKFTYVPNIAGLAVGQYAGVVSCDQQVAAVVNQSNGSGVGSSAGSYGGVDSSKVGNIWYVPGAYNNYYSYYTNMVVQNVSASAVNISVLIYAPGGGAPVATQQATNVQPNGFANFEQSGLAGMFGNVPYSALITSTGNVAVEVNSFGSGATAGQLYSYTPFASGSQAAYAPVIMKNYYGNNTALTVQNIGASSTVITITYSAIPTKTVVTVAGSSSYLAYTPNVPGLPVGTLTSAKIESASQPIVAQVNESSASTNRAASYSAFASGTTKVRAPIVLKRYFAYNTSITCQNVGNAPTDMTIAFAGIATTSSASAVPSGGNALFYQPNQVQLGNGYNGSATITSTGQPIVCVINEDQNEAPDSTQSKDQLYAYEGINQ